MALDTVSDTSAARGCHSIKVFTSLCWFTYSLANHKPSWSGRRRCQRRHVPIDLHVQLLVRGWDTFGKPKGKTTLVMRLDAKKEEEKEKKLIMLK